MLRSTEKLDCSNCLRQEFLAGVDFNETQPNSKDHSSDTISLGEPPPQSPTPIMDVLSILWSYLLYVVLAVGCTVIHTLIFWAMFVAALFLPFVIGVSQSEVSLPATFLQIVGSSWPMMMFLFPVLLIFNAFDFFWHLHDRIAPIPTWIVNRPWSRFEKIIVVGASNLHFGLLKVRYAYNDAAFFVTSSTSHAAMVIDFDLIQTQYLRNLDKVKTIQKEKKICFSSEL